MYVGALPPATIHGTWAESLEVWSVDDDTLADLSEVTEIELKLRDPASRMDDLGLTLSRGEITIPSQGVIEWRAEAGAMYSLRTQLYEVIMLLHGPGNTIVTLILGSISIVE